MMGNYHARCGAGEKPEVVTPEVYLSLLALPDDFCSLLSTMRSREISAVIIIQNLAQIKALFKDTWETIPGNCDTLIYLGGNEQSTHKYISELLGKRTIDKRSTGETRGRQGSSSRNYDVLGRELLTPDEARKFDNKKCLVFIRGYDPILDDKVDPTVFPQYAKTEDGGANAYIHSVKAVPKYEILTPESLRYFQEIQNKGGNVYIDSISYEELAIISELNLQKRFITADNEILRQKFNSEQDHALEYTDPEFEEESDDSSVNTNQKSAMVNKTRDESDYYLPPDADTLMRRLVAWFYSEEQKVEVRRSVRLKMPMGDILQYFYPDMPVEDMKKLNDEYAAHTAGKR